MSASPPRGVRALHSLGLRLTVVLATALFVAIFFLPTLHGWILDRFGLPELTDDVLIDEGVSADSQAQEWDTVRESFPEPLAALDALLDDADRERAGRWIPTADGAELADDIIHEATWVYFWLDTEREVIAHSDCLDSRVGQRLDAPFDGRVVQEDVPTNAFATELLLPVRKENELAGWFVISAHADDECIHILSNDEYVALLKQEMNVDFVMSEEQYQATIGRSRMVTRFVSLGVFVLLAVLLAWLSTFLVTRRLTRIAAALAPAAGEASALPDILDEQGSDEIALVARSLNDMRGRVLEMVDVLGRRDADRRDWVAQVSHDIRTPLTALTACLGRLRNELEQGTLVGNRERLEEALEILTLDADRVGALAEDLLDIARLDADDSTVIEPVPPAELVRQAVRELQPIARQGGIALHSELSPGLPILAADGRRLMRALENLLRNALQHAASRVTVAIEVLEDVLRFEVRDDGPGLPEQHGEVDLEVLAGQKSRADSAGLGLLVTRRVAEAHGGRIGAQNLATGGAAVWFTVPLS